MPRKYSGPLQKGSRSAYVSGSRKNRTVPKAISIKTKKPNYNARYKLSKPFTKVLDSYLNSRDTKHWAAANYSIRQFANVPDEGSLLIPVLPEIPQVNADPGNVSANIASREGNSIRLKSITIDCRVHIPGEDTPGSSDRSSIEVVAAIISCKTYKTFQEVSDNWDVGEEIMNSLMRDGPDASAYFGTPKSNMLDFNRDLFTIHDQKRFYMNRGLLTDNSVLPATGTGHMPTLVKKFKMHIKCKGKQLHYSTPSETLATDFGPFLWIGFAYTNNATPSAAGVPFFQGRTVCRFEDLN